MGSLPFDTPACNGVSGCRGWQQFIYRNGEGVIMVLRVTVNDGTTTAPSCADRLRAESNNLNLVEPCCKHSGGSTPSIVQPEG